VDDVNSLLAALHGDSMSGDVGEEHS